MYKRILNTGFPITKSLAVTGMLALKEKHENFESSIKKLEDMEINNQFTVCLTTSTKQFY